jgi:hypothetical protein
MHRGRRKQVPEVYVTSRGTTDCREMWIYAIKTSWWIENFATVCDRITGDPAKIGVWGVTVSFKPVLQQHNLTVRIQHHGRSQSDDASLETIRATSQSSPRTGKRPRKCDRILEHKSPKVVRSLSHTHPHNAFSTPDCPRRRRTLGPSARPAAAATRHLPHDLRVAQQADARGACQTVRHAGSSLAASNARVWPVGRLPGGRRRLLRGVPRPQPLGHRAAHGRGRARVLPGNCAQRTHPLAYQERFLGLCQMESQDHGRTARPQRNHGSDRDHARLRRQPHRDMRLCRRRRRCLVPGAPAAHGH